MSSLITALYFVSVRKEELSAKSMASNNVINQIELPSDNQYISQCYSIQQSMGVYFEFADYTPPEHKKTKSRNDGQRILRQEECMRGNIQRKLV